MLSVTFPSPVQVRRAWVTNARTTGETVFGWDAEGAVRCDVPDFSEPFPPNLTTKTLSHPRDQVPATPPPAAAAVSASAPFDVVKCDKPFAPVTFAKPVAPVLPDAETGFRSEAFVEIKVAVDETGAFSEAWIVESSGKPSFDQAAMTAAQASSYAPAVAYCQKVKGLYFFTADFKPSTP
jgi:TonB family protein